MKYIEIQKAPRIVEAIQITEYNLEELTKFCPVAAFTPGETNKSKIQKIGVLSDRYVQEGQPRIPARQSEGDWLVKNADGHFAIQENLTFRATYRPEELE